MVNLLRAARMPRTRYDVTTDAYHVFNGNGPPRRTRPPSTNGPPSPRSQNPSASIHARVSQLKPS